MTEADRLSSELHKQKERILIQLIEEIENRVPTDDEMRRYGNCMFFPGGKEEWKWRGVTILVVEPLNEIRRIGWNFTIHGAKTLWP